MYGRENVIRINEYSAAELLSVSTANVLTP